MELKRTAFYLITALVVLFATEAGAIDILVWDRDNNVEIRDWVFGEDLTPAETMTRTLDELDLEYTLHRSRDLPDDVNDYDLVIISLGFFSDC